VGCDSKISQTHRRGRFWKRFVLFEPKAGTVRLTETLVVYLLLVCLLVTWLSFYRGFSRDYIDIPYLCQDSVACLCHLHSLHNSRSRSALPPQSLAFLSRDTTQPPREKVWTNTASTFLGFLISWHYTASTHQGLDQHSLYIPWFSLSCMTTQPPRTKVLVGPCDCKFKIGDNPGLKLPLWPEFFNLMQ